MGLPAPRQATRLPPTACTSNRSRTESSSCQLSKRGRGTDPASSLDVVPKHVVHPALPGGWRCRSPRSKEEDRMNNHANAPLGPKGRAIMVRRVLEEGFALTEAAEAAGVSAKTAGRWVRRYRAEGEAGLLDRSSAPRTVHNATPPDRIEAIAALRRLRMTGPEIAELLEMATSTVS